MHFGLCQKNNINFWVIFVTSFVAKYIGPYRFGQIALSIAIFQVVQVISQMGCDNILFKRASKKRHQRYH